MTLRIIRATSEATRHDRLVAGARLQLPVDELPRIPCHRPRLAQRTRRASCLLSASG